MIRCAMLWLPLLAFAMPADAQAGLRASYALMGEAEPLEAVIADNGDASFSVRGGTDRLAVIGGHAYVITHTDDGSRVVSVSDMAKALATAGLPTLDDNLRNAPHAPKSMVIKPAGIRMVDGRRGKVFGVSGYDVSNPAASLELVTLADPKYAAIGDALVVVMTEGGAIFSLVAEKAPDAAAWLDSFGSLLGLGTPLSMTGIYTLKTIGTESVSPDTVALPGPPISPDALIAELREDNP